jgi:hypothetical protein
MHSEKVVFAHSNHRSIGAFALTTLATIAVACGSTQPTIRPTSNPTATPAPATQTPTMAPTASPTTVPTTTPTGPALLLEVTTEGGFIAPTAHLGQLPTVVVDTAGDIYTADPDAVQTSLIPSAVVRNVGPNGAAQILAAIKAAGLDKENSDNGGVNNPDAGVTVFTVEVDGQEIVNRVVDSGAPGPGHPGGSPDPGTELLNMLLDPSETWGAADVQQAQFTPTAYKVYFAPTEPFSSSSRPGVVWPFSGSLADFGTPATPDFGVTGLRTGAVAGDDATKIAATFADALPDTVVSSGNDVYQVWIRPLLPPELN